MSYINAAAARLAYPINMERQTTGKKVQERPHVVVVDDDPAVCSSLKFSLELEGFAVSTYSGGAELLGAGDISGVKCFVVDQRMSGMSGMELIERLRERKIQTPTILIVSHPNAALSSRAAIAGIPIIEKPLFSNALIDKIREAVGRADGRR